MFEVIKELVENILGSPRRETDGWMEYCCPYCALEKGVESDGKYNLAVNYGEDMKTRPFFHCWRCGTSGKLSKLIKDFGNRSDLSKYYNELKNIKSSLLYHPNIIMNLKILRVHYCISLTLAMILGIFKLKIQ